MADLLFLFLSIVSCLDYTLSEIAHTSNFKLLSLEEMLATLRQP